MRFMASLGGRKRMEKKIFGRKLNFFNQLGEKTGRKRKDLEGFHRPSNLSKLSVQNWVESKRKESNHLKFF